MNFIDLILILIALAGIYIGWCAGVFKSLVDSILFFVSTLIASLVSKIATGYLYQMLPFLNFSGKSQGIKSINIIFWRVVIHLLILLLIIYIFNKISTKIKLKEKLINSMVEINFISRIFGVILYIPVIIVFLYNALLVLHLPNFNFVSMHESKFAGIIMQKTPILASYNSSLYESEKYAVTMLNEENTEETYSQINDSILENLVENNLISSDKAEELKDANKLLGKRTNKVDNDNDYDYEDDGGDYEDDDGDDDYIEDDYDDGDFYYDDGIMLDEDEMYVE